MKILLLDFKLPYLIKDINHPIGGATIEWYAWIKGFIKNDVQIGVLTWRGAKEYIAKSVEFDIVESYDLDEGIPRLRWAYKRLPSLMRAIKNYNPNFLIQECAGFQTGIMGLISKKLNLPFIYRAASDGEADNRYKDRLNIIHKIAFMYGLKKAEAIFCQNSYQYNEFKKCFPEKKILKIHNPYYFDQQLTYFPNYAERRYIAWVGVFKKQKNLLGLPEIVESLSDIQFKIAGKSGADLDSDTRTALYTLQQYKNVEFVGYLTRKQILPFLSNSYALLNTSHYEGFSNTFLEAFAAGTPIVTTEKVDPDNIIANNNLGVVRKENSELPEALISLIRDKNYKEMTERCRKYVIDNHDPKILARKFIENLPT